MFRARSMPIWSHRRHVFHGSAPRGSAGMKHNRASNPSRAAIATALLLGIAPWPSPLRAQPAQPPEALVDAVTVASFPAGTFLESIVIDPQGTMYVADHEKGEILRRTAAGEQSIFGRIEGSLTGLGLGPDGTLHATGRPKGGPESFYTFGRDGVETDRFAVQGAVFLNGMTLLSPGVFLAADSKAGTIWLVEPAKRAAAPWLRHDLLGPRAPDSRFPAANGVKTFGGAVYVSNSDRALVLRVPFGPDGMPAAEPAVFADGLVVDDFALDTWGNFYGTTHPINTVIRVGQDGSRATIAGPAQGVVGSTAAAFGRTDGDRLDLYVVGDGGIFAPIDGKLQEAKLVRLRIEASAARLSAGTPPQVARQSLFVARCATEAGGADVRRQAGPAYLAYLEENVGRIQLGGQVFAEGQSDPAARLYPVRADGADDARRFAEGSPYFKSGLYSGCEVNAFTVMLGDLVGGVTWPPLAR